MECDVWLDRRKTINDCIYEFTLAYLTSID